jgi:hypothetical protein
MQQGLAIDNAAFRSLRLQYVRNVGAVLDRSTRYRVGLKNISSAYGATVRQLATEVPRSEHLQDANKHYGHDGWSRWAQEAHIALVVRACHYILNEKTDEEGESSCTPRPRIASGLTEQIHQTEIMAHSSQSMSRASDFGASTSVLSKTAPGWC